MSEYAIEVENLSIKYKELQSYSIKNSFFSQLKKKTSYFEAVKNVSFKVEKGDIVGIVGTNGSGKSTMLRAIAGIFAPNAGTIDLHGNSISLLSLGVGFQSELSGRENILLSGMLLGFSEEKIRERMDDIIEFSELNKFIDAPVRTYSSGMYSKLAFAITVTLETDIILIDEVLSVGDIRFRQKSFNKMRQLISDSERTVMIVSHDRRTVYNLCNKVLWINNGEMVQYGDTNEVMEQYEKFMIDQTPARPVVQFAYLEIPEADKNASYQWQYQDPGTGQWKLSFALGCSSPKVKARVGYQYRCAIANSAGDISYTDVMLPDPAATINEVPVESNGSEATVNRKPISVSEYTPGSSFVWQYYNPASASWVRSSAKGWNTAEIYARKEFKYRCIIVDLEGNIKFSDVMSW